MPTRVDHLNIEHVYRSSEHTRLYGQGSIVYTILISHLSFGGISLIMTYVYNVGLLRAIKLVCKLKRQAVLTLKVLVTTIDALGHF